MIPYPQRNHHLNHPQNLLPPPNHPSNQLLPGPLEFPAGRRHILQRLQSLLLVLAGLLHILRLLQDPLVLPVGHLPILQVLLDLHMFLVIVQPSHPQHPNLPYPLRFPIRLDLLRFLCLLNLQLTNRHINPAFRPQ